MKVVGALAVGLLTLGPTAAMAGDVGAIQIVSAYYGRASAPHLYDFSRRLQQICGPTAASCEAFCSKAETGARYGDIHGIFGERPICRVVYRCGPETTKATDATEQDTLYLDCKTQ
jgi:hypothetical protein